MADPLAWAALLGGLGAIVGSFLATVAIRWPAGRSAMRGRSACDGCGKTLTAAELVPLASAVLLRGRCRACGAPIDPRHWQIELAAAALGALAGAVAPGVAGVAGAVFAWLLLLLAALDVAELWLPDVLTGSLAAAGLATGVAGLAPGLQDRLIGGAAGFCGLWLVSEGYRRIRGREGLGGGDPKLMGAIGLWLGWRMLPPVLLLASATGLALVLVGRLRGRGVAMDDAVPFGALLAVAAVPVWAVMVGTGA